MEIDRREFLKKSAMAGGALVALGITGCTSPKSEGASIGNKAVPETALLVEPAEAETMEEKAIGQIFEHTIRIADILEQTTHKDWSRQEWLPEISFPGKITPKDTNPPVVEEKSAGWEDATFLETLIKIAQSDEKYFYRVELFANGLLAKNAAFNSLKAAVSQNIGAAGLALGHVWEMTGKEKYRKKAFEAADIMVELFDKDSGMIVESKNSRRSAVNYGAMAIPLLSWAKSNESDPQKAKLYENVANASISALINNFVREDGSTLHYMEKGPDGNWVKAQIETHGLNPETTWTRGMGFFLSSLVDAYEAEPSEKILEAYFKAMTFTVNNTPKLPNSTLPFDLDPNLPEGLKQIYDTSGSALITLSALRMAQKISPESERTLLIDYGRAVIRDIVENHMTGNGGVKNVCPGYFAVNKEDPEDRENSQIETSYGNYYTIQALQESQKIKN